MKSVINEIYFSARFCLFTRSLLVDPLIRKQVRDNVGISLNSIEEIVRIQIYFKIFDDMIQGK